MGLGPVHLLQCWSQFTYLGPGPSLHMYLGPGLSSPAWVWVQVHLLVSGSQFTYLGLGPSSPTWVQVSVGPGFSSPTWVWVSVHLLRSGSQFTYGSLGLSLPTWVRVPVHHCTMHSNTRVFNATSLAYSGLDPTTPYFVF